MKQINKIKGFFWLICFLTGANLVACDSSKKGNTDAETEEVKGDVTLYVTTANRSYDFKKSAVAFSETQNMSPSTITLDPSQRYQTMDGFGAAVTGSSCFNLLQMALDDRAKFLKETFSDSEGMGFSYIRISIGCSDFSLSEYSCCDIKGIENFGLTDEETLYVIPVLKDILAINPKLKVMGSPWTCPPWMKVNNLTDLKPFESWTSGQLNPACYQDYATYFVRWIQAFEGAGIPIYSVTPQNEPLNRGNSASLFMTWQEQRDFVKEALTPKFKEAGLKTKVYLFDHNYNYDNMNDQNDYPIRIYDAGVDQDVVAGSAYHNYGGNREELLDIHDQSPDMELVFTETSIGTWNDGRNLPVRLMADMQEIALGTVNNWCTGVIVWNLMLDTDRGPNRDGGCQTCYGAVDIDRSNYKTITRNSHYYIIGHLSVVVKPGATRIASGGYVENGIVYSAFENTDGTYACVLLNNTNENKKITLEDSKHHFSYEVPSKSVVSYQWKK
ncbi:glucosylceramidase [Bacteroidia bacterium]|nr:glucosylceramidase [Bacteroidia bacterium]GHV04638.1 glucosylceramidase [Bacteroidia bacterium]